MKNWIYILLLFSLRPLFAQEPDAPKLIVGIVVDQMRDEYLQRFRDKFVEDGFRRLMDEGFRFKEMHFNYVPTYTGPGHASIYTGTTPAVHGIVGNHWVQAADRKVIYCVDDEQVKTLGVAGESGKKSPGQLLSTTLSDQLKLAGQFKPRVLSVSLKDRAAILPGGFFADWAFWLDKQSGKMISSSFYGHSLPAWVDDFNRQGRARQWLAHPWETLLPLKSYTESYADDNPYEQLFPGEERPVFPHNLPAIRQKMGLELLYHTPFGNDFLAEFAKAAIEGEDLGNHPGTSDMLMISFSSTDVVGHRYGPQSVEVEDTYLRLDRTLSALFRYLDEKIGKGRYLLFLTSDHGVAEVPAYIKDKNGAAGYFNSDSLFQGLKARLFELFHDSLAIAAYNHQIYFNPEKMPPMYEAKKAIYEAVKDYYLQQEGVARVYTEYDMAACGSGDAYCDELSRGFLPARSGEVLILLKPGWLSHEMRGSSHGSPYNYDTHVPFLLYGWHIPKGANSERVFINDVAPTICELLGIDLPSGNTGKGLTNKF